MSTATIVLVVLIAIDLSFRLIALVIVPPNRRPQTSMAWLLAIFFIPFFAFLAFLAFGSTKLSPTRQRKQRTINEYLGNIDRGIPRELIASPNTLATMTNVPAWLPPATSLTTGLGHLPLTRNNSVEFLADYEDVFDRMARDIDQATVSVNALFYIMSDDPSTNVFFEALENAVGRGVTVRVLYDQVATIRITGSRDLVRRLRSIGVEFYPMLPFQPWRGVYQRPDLRNHRKILVIDSAVAYTGSQNIIESGYRDPKHRRRNLRWKDLTVRVTGPLVHSLEAVFTTDWFHETDELIPLEPPKKPTGKGKNQGQDIVQVVHSGPAIDGETNLRLFLEMMFGATTRILIVSPYLVPDDSMRYAITSAALRGVRVDIVVSEIGDQPLVFYAQRSYYEELLTSGAHLYQYPAPTILHPKFVVVDDQVAVFGSSNLDMRSFTLNLELTLLFVGPPATTTLTTLGDEYISDSTELTLGEWQTRSRKERIKEGLARLTATVQ
jgi:cardiolipin synthase